MLTLSSPSGQLSINFLNLLIIHAYGLTYTSYYDGHCLCVRKAQGQQSILLPTPDHSPLIWFYVIHAFMVSPYFSSQCYKFLFIYKLISFQHLLL